MSPREVFWEAVQGYLRASIAATRHAGEAHTQAVERAAEDVDRACDDMPAVRRRLPTLRRAQKFEFKIGGVRGDDGAYAGGVKLHVQLGFYADGRVGEVFLDTSKEGSDLRHFMNAFAVAVSLLLQVGAPVPLVAHALEHLSGGPQGDVDGPDELEITKARSMVDLVAKVLRKVEEGRA